MSQMEAVEAILRRDFGGSLGSGPLDPRADLLARGIIDSFGLIGLIASLEKAFGIEIVEEDIVPEHFQSLERLAAFVDAKTSGSGDRSPSHLSKGE